MRQQGASQVIMGMGKMILVILLVVSQTVVSQLQSDFYYNTCEYAEGIVSKIVSEAVRKNPGLGAGLLRMHFHDCFVRGCDASVLIDSTAHNQAEKDSFINNPSLRGFEVIDAAKAALEAICPGVVSCADTLAFAARDSVAALGGPYWNIRSGRKDGNVSVESDVIANLPPPFFNLEQLTQNFKAKGLSQFEMITLSGAHTIGGSHCTSFSNRLYTFNSTVAQDPTLNPHLAASLKHQCPQANFDPNLRVGMDSFTPNRFDNKYYRGLTSGRGLFTSDETLFTSGKKSALTVKLYSKYQRLFNYNFVNAMIKMSEIEVKTGLQGEIRRNCHVVNPAH
ncbi:hypothetical protein O6H91_14G074200 [Diphasiastrum complanatum]|uniref:Uncharacterized protein n=1 Tax=Diphasiastrum complanatum TaxID=34168 RepID=A0ACC2BQV7_DIPCM|nr:hypothetical protein O6H91_14G074200 [Diphasiastrum complanatum]